VRARIQVEVRKEVGSEIPKIASKSMADLMIDVVLEIASGTEITSISIWLCTLSIPSHEYGPISDARDRCSPGWQLREIDRLLASGHRWSILFDPPDPELDELDRHKLGFAQHLSETDEQSSTCIQLFLVGRKTHCIIGKYLRLDLGVENVQPDVEMICPEKGLVNTDSTGGWVAGGDIRSDQQYSHICLFSPVGNCTGSDFMEGVILKNIFPIVVRSVSSV
jgi:hypothetical protein